MKRKIKQCTHRISYCIICAVRALPTRSNREIALLSNSFMRHTLANTFNKQNSMGNFDFIKLTNGSVLFVAVILFVLCRRCSEIMFFSVFCFCPSSFGYRIIFDAANKEFWVASVHFQLTYYKNEQTDHNRSEIFGRLNELWYFYHLQMISRKRY